MWVEKTQHTKEIPNALVSYKLNNVLQASLARALSTPSREKGDSNDTLLVNYLTCHYHIMPREGGEDKVFFLSFITIKTITNFHLTIYDKKR